MHHLLGAWESFYVIIGAAAAGLIGLQFVATVLGAEVRVVGGESVTRAFGTPTIVHFCVVLLNAGILSAPWPTVSSLAAVLGAFGAGGVLYTLRVARHARVQKVYEPVLEDWIWHAILPVLAYAALLVSAILLPGAPARTLFSVAASAALLLCIGIHNAWDSLNYIAQRRAAEEQAERAPDVTKSA